MKEKHFKLINSAGGGINWKIQLILYIQPLAEKQIDFLIVFAGSRKINLSNSSADDVFYWPIELQGAYYFQYFTLS